MTTMKMIMPRFRIHLPYTCTNNYTISVCEWRKHPLPSRCWIVTRTAFSTCLDIHFRCQGQTNVEYIAKSRTHKIPLLLQRNRGGNFELYSTIPNQHYLQNGICCAQVKWWNWRWADVLLFSWIFQKIPTSKSIFDQIVKQRAYKTSRDIVFNFASNLITEHLILHK